MKGKPIQPGCLAMIVNAKKAPENNGRIVRVIRKAEPYYVSPDSPVPRLTEASFATWVVVPVDTTRPLFGIVVHIKTRKVLSKFPTLETGVRDRCLIRLDDDDAPAETRVTETHKPQTDEVI